jgi:hypothetical protein
MPEVALCSSSFSSFAIHVPCDSQAGTWDKRVGRMRVAGEEVNYIPPLEYQVEKLLSSVILFHAQLVWPFGFASGRCPTPSSAPPYG